MDERELQNIENELLSNINEEVKADNEIINAAEEIAATLILSGSTQYSFNDIVYSFRYICNSQTKTITIVVANVNKYKIAGNKYKPFIINVTLDESYSELQCATSAIEAFIRHVTGTMKPEYIEEGE